MEKCGEIMLSYNSKFIFVCAFCNEDFQEMLSFGKHLEEIHLKFGNELKDDTTNPLVINPVELDIEMKNEPVIETITRDQINFDTDTVENDDSELVEPLNESNYVAFEKIYLQTNSKVENYTDSDDLISISPQKQEQNYKRQTYKCNQCPAIYDQQKIFAIHIQTHSLNQENIKDSMKTTSASLNTLKCDHCNRVFRLKVNLGFHLENQTCMKNHICPYCSKRLMSKEKLASHIRIHTGERPFKCTYCPKSFACKTNLTVHIRRHLGDKRYSCKICDKRFVHSTEINNHMRTHTGEKPFQCDECGQKLTTSSELTRHKNRHANIRNHKCEICSKTFFRRWQLRTHLVVHSDERPFKCDTCSATFPRKRALQSHIKIHSDIKEYVCTICDKAFAQNAGLYSHMKSHGVRLGQTPKTE